MSQAGSGQLFKGLPRPVLSRAFHVANIALCAVEEQFRPPYLPRARMLAQEICAKGFNAGYPFLGTCR